MTISGFGYRVSSFSGTDYGALAIANGLTLVGWYRSDLGVTGTSGTGKASLAPVAGSLSAITPHGSATNGIGSVGAGLNGKASLIQDGSTQKGLLTAPTLAAPGTTNIHKYWIARQVGSGIGTPRGILQEGGGGAYDVYLANATSVLASGTGIVTGQNLTNNVFQRYRVTWCVNPSEFKLGNLTALTSNGTSSAPNTARTFGDILTSYEWLMYLECTGPKANFLTFAAAADTAARTVDWTTAIEI